MPSTAKYVQALRKFAMKHDDVEEGIACAGTALECATFKTNKKAFLFLGTANARLKLQDSLAEAAKLAKAEHDRYKAGANGWVEVKFAGDEAPPLDVMTRWIDESYQLMAAPLSAKKKTPKKKEH